MITDLTIQLVESMANNPASSRALREFHQTQLADIRHRAALERRARVESPFARFLDQLETERPTP